VTRPHANATSIHKGAYVSATDPGPVGADKMWIDKSTGPPYALWVRNTANTAWEGVGTGGGGGGGGGGSPVLDTGGETIMDGSDEVVEGA
jgi:hypothetical protein